MKKVNATPSAFFTVCFPPAPPPPTPFSRQPKSALLMATQHAHGTLAAELLKAGARMDTATGRGFTPLMLASMYGQHDLLADLLDRGRYRHASCPPKQRSLAPVFCVPVLFSGFVCLVSLASCDRSGQAAFCAIACTTRRGYAGTTRGEENTIFETFGPAQKISPPPPTGSGPDRDGKLKQLLSDIPGAFFV